MDDKGYAFTPIAFLITIPVLILAVSYGGIIDEINSISAIAIGGDVTAGIANSVVTAIKQNTGDAGRNSAFLAVQSVIDHYNLQPNNNPFFSKTGTNTSKAFIIDKTKDMLNMNITSTARELEKQTGRDIYLNGNYVVPNGNNTVTLFNSGDLSITQSDPWGFYINVPSVNVTVIQNSNQSYQNVTFKTPPQNVYVSIEKLEDAYIWTNTKARQSNIIWRYPYYTEDGNYHFADDVSAARLSYLYECLVGANSTMGYRPYYFPDTHGLTFFDRLENRTAANSLGPDGAKMSTFILNDPLINEHGNKQISTVDNEYFTNIIGITLTTKKGSTTTTVTDPTGRNFVISTTYLKYLFNTTDSQFTY